VLCQVQTIEGARTALDAGADVLVAQGNEAGGHTGQLGTLPFLSQVLELSGQTPVIASGGIASGRALAAVLAAGGEGAWIGTPLLATHEAVEVPPLERDPEVHPIWMGQSAGSVHGVRAVDEVIADLCDGAERLLRERSRTLVG